MRMLNETTIEDLSEQIKENITDYICSSEGR